MNIKSVSTMLCVAVLASTAAFAQPAADDGLSGRRALVQRYMAATHFNDRMTGFENLLLPQMLEQIRKDYPNTPANISSAIQGSAVEAMADFIPKLESRLADLMAAKFSSEELEQVVAFYESPVGQKAIAKSGEMMSSIQPLARELIPGLQADMLRRLCAKIDCSTLPKPAPT